jgi:hypothetical protein
VPKRKWVWLGLVVRNLVDGKKSKVGRVGWIYMKSRELLRDCWRRSLGAQG